MVSPVRGPRPIAIYVALGAALVLGLGVGSLPGFGGPGYEIALVSGLLLPVVVCVCVAHHLSRAAQRSMAPFDALSRGAATGVATFGALLFTTLIHGVRVGFCDLWSGLVIMVLGPAFGLTLAGVWGWVAEEASRFVSRSRLRSIVRVGLALAGPLGGVVISLFRYYTSPMIFAYDPFVGYFSGTIYDTVIEFGTLATYRLGTMASLLAITIGATHLARGNEPRLGARGVWIRRPGVLLLGLAALIASVSITVEGPVLGHWTTRSTIEQELGGRVDGERCLVIHARTIERERVRLFAAECEAHITLNEVWWGARGPDKITAFLFTDEDQKARLMGASGTNIAKPWRAEIYVQNTDFPHRVLQHELMHAIAGQVGEGPFDIGGYWGGWLPNPGLIEGVAVAGAPKEDDLSAMEWAKTMQDLQILPRLDKLFSLGFLGESSSMAYTVSGAFVGWAHDKYGAKPVRDWYSGRSVDEAFGKSLHVLEQEWLADVSAIELPEAARIQATARFDRPGFFARRCPRIVDKCRDDADTLAAAGDTEGALAKIAEARAWEPDNPALPLDEASTLLRDDPDRALELYASIADDEDQPRYARDRAIEALGDSMLKRDDVEGARAAYADLIDRTIDESKLRTLHVKLAAAKGDEKMRAAIVTLLLGQGDQKPDRTAAAVLLGMLDAERPQDGLPAYLLGRYFVDVPDYPKAETYFTSALSRKLEVPRVRIEALRLRLLASVGALDCDTAKLVANLYVSEPEVHAARAKWGTSFVDLCFEMKQKLKD